MNILKRIIDWIISKFIKKPEKNVYINVGKDCKVDISDLTSKADHAIVKALTNGKPDQKFAYFTLMSNEYSKDKLNTFKGEMKKIGIEVDDDIKYASKGDSEGKLITLCWDKLDLNTLKDKIKR